MNPYLENIIVQLKSKNALPKKMEVASVSSYCFANMFDEISSDVISESVSCGFDKDPDLAILKGLSEFFENRAFREGYKAGLDSCQTERSDGFAAFPNSKIVDYKGEARKNAFQEAIERFVWASWWDDPSVGFDLLTTDEISLNPAQIKLVKNIQSKYGLKKILAIRPCFEKFASESLLIFIGFLNGDGVVSGGACGDNIVSTVDRALSELFRHTLAITRMRTGKGSAGSFYERRLEYFSTLSGQAMVESRLSQVGYKSIKLPSAQFDIEIPHSLSNIFYVHRFLFCDQPAFIGGKLERFCI